MTYKGDEHLQSLLSAVGETRPVAEIKETLKGINAAPADMGEPDRWVKLFRTNGNTEAVAQLAALKEHLAANQNSQKQNKLADLRAEMAKRGVDGFFVPRADEFQGEYVPARAERLEWVSGFTGSAGSAVVLKDKAGFFTDGRYTLQSKTQVNAQDFEICNISENQGSIPTMTPAEWIEKNVTPGMKFGIDPWVHTPNGLKEIRNAVEKAGGTLVLLDSNPLDAAWKDQPPAPLAPVVPQPLQYAGKPSEDKRHELAQVLTAKGADAIAVGLPEETAWLLNIRGGDVPRTPFALSYAIAHKDGSVDWYVDSRKVTEDTHKWVGADVRFHEPAEFAKALEALGKAGKSVWVDPGSSPVKAAEIVKSAGGSVVSEKSPIQLMKAKKNAVEIQGTIDAHIRDGVAVTRFLSAISGPDAGKYDEITASDLLQKFREEGKNFRDLSFDTISGAGANGAIVHYRSSDESKKPLLDGPIYLVDSGAQYLDGTTDITRTVAVAPVTPEMKDHFTRVLKGHIQVAMSVFPEGTVGKVLDDKARAALKEVGLDYAHGTGHGVGSYLSVHEGPAGITPRSTSVPFEPGMIVSNEPGYYKEGAYGIRIESLVTVVETGKTDADGKKLLAFKTLTMAPIDTNLVEPSLMTADELKWFNDYHAEVRATLKPLLEKTDPKAAAFLEKATAPIGKPASPKPPKNLCL